MPPPRPRLVLLLVPLALLLLALLLPRPAAADPRVRWRWPVVHGEVRGGFRYAPRHPFAAAQRRGIDIAAAPGAPVRSACAGRVTFAGPVPGGGGLGVTVRCGALVATHLGLGRLAVRRGARVDAAQRIGVVGRGGRVRLGARRASSQFGYIDPAALLTRDPTAGGPGPLDAPLGRAPRAPATPSVARGPLPAARPPAPALRPRPYAGARAAGAGVPPLAWAGLVVLAAGLPLGGLVHRRRRRRRATRAVAGAAAAR
jgi:peptidase M23-like protein